MIEEKHCVDYKQSRWKALTSFDDDQERLLCWPKTLLGTKNIGGDFFCGRVSFDSRKQWIFGVALI